MCSRGLYRVVLFTSTHILWSTENRTWIVWKTGNGLSKPIKYYYYTSIHNTLYIVCSINKSFADFTNRSKLRSCSANFEFPFPPHHFSCLWRSKLWRYVCYFSSDGPYKRNEGEVSLLWLHFQSYWTWN